MKTKQVLVIGGGFAGTQAIAALKRRAPDTEVRLIDPNPYATMVPALPDVVSGRVPQDAFSAPFGSFLPKGTTYTQDQVGKIDLTARQVEGLNDSYGYDYLVIANGSKPEFFGFEPENGGILHTVHSLPSAGAFREAVVTAGQRDPNPEVLVVGGGYTGLEIAASLRYGSERSGINPRIRIVELAEEIVTFLPEKTRDRIKAYLEERRIELLTGTSLSRLDGETAYLSNGETVSQAVVCWSAGMRASQDQLVGEVERSKDGRIETTRELQIPAHPEVFVAGDAASLRKEGQQLRRAVNFSYLSGRSAGANLGAVISGGRPTPFTPVDLGWVIPLSEMSTGRILSAIPVGGALGLRLHYFMCGFRHFSAGKSWQFYKTAAYLRRNPAPLENE